MTHVFCGCRHAAVAHTFEHRAFMHAVVESKNAAAALAFLDAMPRHMLGPTAYLLAQWACRKISSMEVGFKVLDRMAKHSVPLNRCGHLSLIRRSWDIQGYIQGFAQSRLPCCTTATCDGGRGRT